MGSRESNPDRPGRRNANHLFVRLVVKIFLSGIWQSCMAWEIYGICLRNNNHGSLCSYFPRRRNQFQNRNMFGFELANCHSAGMDVTSDNIRVGDMLMFRGYTGTRKYLAVVIAFSKSRCSTKSRPVYHNRICFFDENNRLIILVTPSSFLDPLEK